MASDLSFVAAVVFRGIRSNRASLCCWVFLQGVDISVLRHSRNATPKKNNKFHNSLCKVKMRVDQIGPHEILEIYDFDKQQTNKIHEFLSIKNISDEFSPLEGLQGCVKNDKQTKFMNFYR